MLVNNIHNSMRTFPVNPSLTFKDVLKMFPPVTNKGIVMLYKRDGNRVVVNCGSLYDTAIGGSVVTRDIIMTLINEFNVEDYVTFSAPVQNICKKDNTLHCSLDNINLFKRGNVRGVKRIKLSTQQENRNNLSLVDIVSRRSRFDQEDIGLPATIEVSPPQNTTNDNREETDGSSSQSEDTPDSAVSSQNDTGPQSRIVVANNVDVGTASSSADEQKGTNSPFLTKKEIVE